MPTDTDTITQAEVTNAMIAMTECAANAADAAAESAQNAAFASLESLTTDAFTDAANAANAAAAAMTALRDFITHYAGRDAAYAEYLGNRQIPKTDFDVRQKAQRANDTAKAVAAAKAAVEFGASVSDTIRAAHHGLNVILSDGLPTYAEWYRLMDG